MPSFAQSVTLIERLIPYRNISLLNTGQVIKAGPGEIGGWVLCNNATSARFVKLYNQTAAPDSSSTPYFTIELPASSISSLSFADGIDFLTGIGLRATTGIADNDNGAPSANDVVVSIFYR